MGHCTAEITFLKANNGNKIKNLVLCSIDIKKEVNLVSLRTFLALEYLVMQYHIFGVHKEKNVTINSVTLIHVRILDNNLRSFH